MARKHNNKPIRSVKPAFAIIGDGETEQWYFQMLKRNERQLRIDIKPILLNTREKQTLAAQFKKAKELAQDYSKVFWVIDLDTIIKETREAAKGTKTKMQELIASRSEIARKYAGKIVMVVNNPCLEFWLLLHFEATGSSFADCETAEKRLKKHLPDYEKTEKYYTKQNNDIYLKLKSRQAKAIENAKKLGLFNAEDAEKTISEMFLLFEAIL